MKLEPKQIADLNAVLTAQTELKTTGKVTMDKDAYKAAIASVGQFMKVGEDKKPTGGVIAAVYKNNPEIKAASEAHLAAAKLPKPEKAAKAAPAKAAKAAPAEKAAPAKAVKGAPRTPEQEKATADHFVAYVNAITGKKKLPLAEFNAAEIACRTHRDPKKGGLKGKEATAEGKTPAWDRFKDFPGVKEAAKAHQAHVKAKGKEAPAPEM